MWTQNGASGTLQVENASNAVLESLTLDGTYAQSGFALTESGSVDQITYVSYHNCSAPPNLSDRARATRAASATPSSSRAAISIVGYDCGTGTATNTTISSGGRQFVGDIGGTGTATSTTINGGIQYVGYAWYRHGDEHDDQQRRPQYVGDGGVGVAATATSTTILSGGDLRMSARC